MDFFWFCNGVCSSSSGFSSMDWSGFGEKDWIFQFGISQRKKKTKKFGDKYSEVLGEVIAEL